jgi:hypothetical protein
LTDLLLKRAATSRSRGEWNEDDYDVLADGDVVGRIYKANAAPVSNAWMWTLAFGHHQDRIPTHGYAATREAANGRLCQELAAGNEAQCPMTKTPRLSASHRGQQGYGAS